MRLARIDTSYTSPAFVALRVELGKLLSRELTLTDEQLEKLKVLAATVVERELRSGPAEALSVKMLQCNVRVFLAEAEKFRAAPASKVDALFRKALLVTEDTYRATLQGWFSRVLALH